MDVDAERAEEQEGEAGGLADTLKAIVSRTMPCPRYVRFHEAHVQRYLSRLKAFPPRCAHGLHPCGHHLTTRCNVKHIFQVSSICSNTGSTRGMAHP